MAAPVLSTANRELREKMQRNRIALWKVAKKLGMSESTLCRHMRYELEEPERQEVSKAIEELAKAAV